METPQDFKSLQDGIQKALVSTVKSVNRIAAEDLGFQRTVNPDVAQELDDKSARVLELSTRLLQSAAKACGVKAPKLEDAEDIDMSWQSIVDVVDSVLEKADTAMDEYTGLIKRKEPPRADSVSIFFWFINNMYLTRTHLILISPRVPSRNERNLPPRSFETPMSPSRRQCSRRNPTTSLQVPGNRFSPTNHMLLFR